MVDVHEGKILEAYAILGKLADIEKRLEQIEERLERLENKLDGNRKPES